ncbi:MAG: hypothetical protein EBZ77_05455, partial [Chitinophagia bacterium]|nr:hypothetical protein [Chitinophagia bacterium]
MKKNYFLILLLTALSFASRAQYSTMQNSKWCFGNRAGVDFTSGTPTAFTASGITTNEGCASIADASGNLLFYTDGKKIWNSSFGVMTGGGSIVSFGTSSSTQGALIIPVLGSGTQYYVFSLEEVSFGTGYCHLAYCIVDMSLSGGLGAVVTGTAGTPLASDLGEKMTAVQGANCDIWLVTHRRDSTVFLSYHITSSGLDTVPVRTTIGAITSTGSYGAYGIGVLVASPNSRLLCTQTYNSGRGSVGTELYDFDPNTGVVSNLRVIDSLNSEYGAEFSPNSQFLYTNDNVSGARISQYDVTGSTAAAISSSRYTVATGSGYPQMKLGPDGKIYFPSISASSSAAFLDVIANPNTSGSGCGYSSRAVSLASGTSAVYGMPNAIILGGLNDTTFYRHDTTVCIAPGDSISLAPHIAGTRYFWDNGDTAYNHFIHGPGTYICYVSTSCHVDVDTIQVIQPPFDTTVYTTNLVVCIPAGRTLTLTAAHSGTSYLWDDASTLNNRAVSGPGNYSVAVRNSCHIDLEKFNVSLTPPDTTKASHDSTKCSFAAPLTLNARAGYVSYRWENGAGGTTHVAATNGTYFVYATDTCRNVFIDTFHVTFRIPDTTKSVKMDTSLCVTRGALRLDGGLGFASYAWSTGSSASNISVTTSNIYWVSKQLNCTLYADTFKVNFIPVPTLNLGPDLLRCVGDTVLLTSVQPAGTTYLWSDGSTGTSLAAYSTGTYWLTLFNGCVITDSVNITVSAYPVVALGNDTLECFGHPVLLHSSVTYPSTATYAWSTGANTDTTSATTTGYYWLKVTNLGCSGLDTIQVTIFHDTFTLYNLDTAICAGKQVQALLTADPAATFQWLPTAGILFPNSSSPLIKPDTTTMYHVLIGLANCPVVSDSFLIDVQPYPTVYAGGNQSIC